MEKCKGRLLQRLRKRRGGVDKSWAAIDTELVNYFGDIYSSRSLHSRMGAYFDDLSDIMKYRKEIVNRSEIENLYATFLEVSNAMSLFFQEFDLKYGSS